MVVKMETFDQDLHKILSSKGFEWLPVSHLNSHNKDHNKKGINVKKPTQKLTSTPTIDTAQIEEMFDSTHP